MNSAALTFDRLAYIDRLKIGGIDEDQARAHAAALDSALRDSVATKSDVEIQGRNLRTEIADLGRELRAEIADLGRELRTEMSNIRRELREGDVRLEAKIETVAAALKVDILRWLVVTQVALGGFTLAIVKFIH